MSEIVHGRTRGYMTIENYIEDGLLEVGSIDLAGFYGALKRFVDRRDSGEGKTAMPWTVDLFCNKFKIGKQRFYRLSELLWKVGLLDVEKKYGIINPEKGVMGWRNQYVVHDYPEYEGPLRLVRDGSYKYKKAKEENEAPESDKKVSEQECLAEVKDEHEEMKEKKNEKDGGEGVFLYRNTPENMFGGISTTGIPATGIPATGIPIVERYIKEKRSKKQESNKKQEKDNKQTIIHSSIHHKEDNTSAREGKKCTVDNVDKGTEGASEIKSVKTAAVKTILTDAGFEGLPVEVEYISKWFDVFSPEMFKYAVNKAVLKGIRSLPYIAGIFEDWVKKGIRTVEQAERETRYDSILVKTPEKGKMFERVREIKLSDSQLFRDYQRQLKGG